MQIALVGVGNVFFTAGYDPSSGAFTRTSLGTLNAYKLFFFCGRRDATTACKMQKPLGLGFWEGRVEPPCLNPVIQHSTGTVLHLYGANLIGSQERDGNPVPG